MKKKVLVCGATGFIGRNLVEKLASRDDLEIHAVRFTRSEFEVRPAPGRVTWCQADLRNPRDVEKVMRDVDIVIQAAATTSGSRDIVAKPYIHVTDNAIMNSYLLREAFNRKVKHFIFFSCTVMYPSSDVALPESAWDGSNDIHPRYFGVGHTKVYIEKMLEFYSSISEMKTTAIRHSNIYGKYDKFDLERSHVFGATITKAMQATDRLVVWGTGEEERDLLHVDDLVAFVEGVIESQPTQHRIYNCGSGRSVSIRELVSKIVKATGKNIKIEHDLSQPTIKTSLFLDNSLAFKEIGWMPKVALEDGISSTLAWWRDNFQTNDRE